MRQRGRGALRRGGAAALPPKGEAALGAKAGRAPRRLPQRGRRARRSRAPGCRERWDFSGAGGCGIMGED